MATIDKPQEVPTPSSVYVVVGESYDQMEDNEKDVINIRHGILRIFANKDDVKAYMQKYFNEDFPDDATFRMCENKKDFYKAEIDMKSRNNIKGAVSFEGSLEGRVYKLNIKAYKVDITIGVDGLIADDDLYDALYD